MTPRSRVLSYDATNAVLGWIAIVVLTVAGVVYALAGDVFAAGVAMVSVGIALVPPAVHGRPTEMVAWEVLALVTIAIVVPFFGLFGRAVQYLPVATLALVVAVELDAFTDVRMTPDFAVGFVVAVTMAVGALWVIARYASDAYLGTSLLTTQSAVMWDLIFATGVGIAAGLVFELYFRRLSPGHNKPSRKAESFE